MLTSTDLQLEVQALLERAMTQDPAWFARALLADHVTVRNSSMNGPSIDGKFTFPSLTAALKWAGQALHGFELELPITERDRYSSVELKFSGDRLAWRLGRVGLDTGFYFSIGS